MAVKILVLEDRINDFNLMVKPLIEIFGNGIEVYPKEGKEKNIEQFYFFRQEVVQTSEFKLIIDHYKDSIDLFILDAHLLDDKDMLGKKFYKYLKEINYRNGDYKIIEVSSGPSEIKKFDATFISKSDNPMYYNLIVRKVSELFPNLKVNEDRTSEIGAVKLGYLDRFVTFLGKVDKFARWSIHAITVVSFYLLLPISVIFALYKILLGFKEIALAPGANSEQTSTDQAKTIQHGIEIFAPAENIFLYLLPVFILFGFYNYYKTNTSIYLLNGNKERINEDASTRSMNLTKMIFISTIISYLVIKIIEQIFYGKEQLDLIHKIGAAGGILLLMMTFFLLMYRKH